MNEICKKCKESGITKVCKYKELMGVFIKAVVLKNTNLG